MRCCGNCEWSNSPLDIEELGECALSIDHEGMYVCSSHRFKDDDIQYDYQVIYDQTYFGKGYFIVCSLDGEIVKYMKLSEANEMGMPLFVIKGYEKDKHDTPDDEFREISLTVRRVEHPDLFKAIKEFSDNMSSNILVSRDPLNQGKSHLKLYSGVDYSKIALFKDVYYTSGDACFVDLGDDYTCDRYNDLLSFYRSLGSIAEPDKDNVVEKIIKMK